MIFIYVPIVESGKDTRVYRTRFQFHNIIRDPVGPMCPFVGRIFRFRRSSQGNFYVNEKFGVVVT